jgi:hypothetical protein
MEKRAYDLYNMTTFIKVRRGLVKRNGKRKQQLKVEY